MFELVDSVPQNAVIKVIGVGGGGGNAVKHMIECAIDGVEFVCANTDAQALKDIDAKTVLQLGHGITKGLGAGANPEIGRQAAMEDRERIAEVLRGSDMVFITAGMGGGTGTGGAPVVAEVAREMGILTVAVVTKPFPFEGRKRMMLAEEGIKQLQDRVDSLITIPNEKLLSVLGKTTSLLEAFKAANNVLLGAVQGIADLIIRPGMINVDFADVKTIMSEAGTAVMGIGKATGAVLTCAQNNGLGRNQTGAIGGVNLDPLGGDARIGHAAQHFDTFHLQTGTVNPACGLAKALAGLFGLALQQRDLARGGVGLWPFGRKAACGLGRVRNPPFAQPCRQIQRGADALVDQIFRHIKPDAPGPHHSHAVAHGCPHQDIGIAQNMGIRVGRNARIPRNDPCCNDDFVISFNAFHRGLCVQS